MSGPDGVRDVGGAYEALSARPYRAYPGYKDSGVEWLGEVPAHWVVKSLKWASPVQRGASPRPINDPISENLIY